MYGIGRGPIWLNHVHCLENKKSIDECLHKGWGVKNSCTHRDDVTISCSTGMALHECVPGIHRRLCQLLLRSDGSAAKITLTNR